MAADYHVITLDKKKHEFLLEQKVKDGFTQKPFEAGDHVVVCGGMNGNCRCAWLEDTWIEINYKCESCKEVGRTLSELVQPIVHFKKPVIHEFRATPKLVVPGQPVTLTWKVDNAQTILLNGNPVSGETEITIVPDRPTRYVLQARNSKGWAPERVVEVRFAELRARLYAEPGIVAAGQPVRLCWEIENATFANLENGLGTLPNLKSGHIEVFPRKDTRYTLTFGNGFEEKSVETFVRLPEVRVFNFRAERNVVAHGTSLRLSWQSENAERIQISGIGEVTGSTYEYFVQETADFQLELVAFGLYGEKSAKALLPIQVARIESLKVEQYGSAALRQYRLTWQSHYLENLTVDQGIGKVVGKSTVIPASDETITYTLTGETRFGGKISCSLILTPARIHAFDILPNYAFIGMKGKLQWDVSNSQRLEIDRGIGSVSGNEHSFFFSEQHTALTLTAYGEINVATCSLEAKIARPPAIILVKVPTPAIDMKLNIPKIGITTELADAGWSIARRPKPQPVQQNHHLKINLPTMNSWVSSKIVGESGLNFLGDFARKKFELWSELLQKFKKEIIKHIYNGQY